MIPRHSMSPDEYCGVLGIPRSTLKMWTRPRGFLFGVPREPGRYSPADTVLGFILLALQDVLGPNSGKSHEYVTEISPRIRAMVNSGTMPSVFKIQIGDGPVVLTIDLNLMEDAAPAETIKD